MARQRYISVGDEILAADRIQAGIPAKFYIRQNMRTSDGRILNADLHMEFFRRAVRRILDMPLAISERQINETTARLLRENLIPPDIPTEISVYLVLESDALLPVISCREILLDRTYALQGTRPAAEIFEYSHPYPSFRTSVSDAASIPFDNKAFSMSAAVSVRCENGVLLAARGEALLAMHGKTLIATPTECGAADSVERRIALEAAREAGIPVEQREIRADSLHRYDEMMIVDTLGITSLSECAGAKFGVLSARRLAELMAGFRNAAK